MDRAQEVDLVRLKTDDSSVCIHLHGATVISWVYREKELIFVSEQAIFDNKKAIRGGIPFVFPNFGPWQLGPQHGFARISRWTVAEPAHPVADGGCAVTLALVDSEETRKMWNYRFKLLYKVLLTRNNLILDVSVTNTGDAAFSFTLLLHTYLRLEDIKHFTVSGLQGCPYVDKMKNGAHCTESQEQLAISGPTDRVYSKTSNSHTCSVAGKAHVIVKKANFPDTVIWNPWSSGAAAMADFGNEEYHKMVCVEPGHVTDPTKLSPGQTFEASCTMEVVE